MAVHRRRRGGYPPLSKVTIVGQNEIFPIGKIWLGHFWYTNSWVPDPPPSSSSYPPSNTSLGGNTSCHARVGLSLDGSVWPHRSGSFVDQGDRL